MKEQDPGKVIPFPVHHRSTIEETLAGFPEWTASGPAGARTERTVTVLFSDIRGWPGVAGWLGPAGAEALLGAAVREAVEALEPFGALDVTLAGDPTQPLLSATFQEEGHAVRALQAAVAVREAVGRAQLPALPGHRFQACSGLNTGSFVEAQVDAGNKVAFQSVGTVRMFAVRLQEFAGPGQIFLSADTYGEVAGSVSVRSIGQVRTNPDGETREAFCLTEVLAAVAPVARSRSAAPPAK